MKNTNSKKQKRDRKKRAKRKRKAALRAVERHHKSPATIGPELKKDMRWFSRHPEENQRSRPPSAGERREWPELIEVLVLRLDVGFATIPFTAETADT